MYVNHSSPNMHKVDNEYFSLCECMHNYYQLCDLDGQGFRYVASGPMVGNFSRLLCMIG